MRLSRLGWCVAGLLVLASGCKHTTEEAKDVTDAEVVTGKRPAAGSEDGDVTADDQSNSQEDVDITAKIRRSIVSMDWLSTDAKNVKVVTRDRIVTLRGVVMTEQEREAVENAAIDVAGPYNVTSQLVIHAH
jgi:hyperosmotically inducible periplasmic protein